MSDAFTGDDYRTVAAANTPASFDVTLPTGPASVVLTGVKAGGADNSGTIYVGGSAVDASDGKGIPISPGATVSLDFPEATRQATIHYDGTATGDGLAISVKVL